MKFHTRVQLQKEEKNIDDNDKPFTYVYPRYGLRGCATQIVDIFIETVKEYMEDLTFKDDDSLDVMYSTYADGHEAFFKINGEEMEGEDQFVGDFFEVLPEVIIIMHGSNSPLRTLEPGQTDAVYSHDFQDAHEAGEIDVTVRFPVNPNNVSSFLEESRKELIGLLAHEMQHAVQKLVYGARLSEHAVQTVKSHIEDIYEIDARVEEILARLPEHVREENEASFLAELELYIDQYLSRNASQEPDLDEIRSAMVTSHLEHYNRKLGKHNVL